MFAVHGSAEQAKRSPTSREASAPGPEASLSWCLAQLSKAGSAARAQKDGQGPQDLGEREKVKEADRRVHASLWRALVAIRTRHIKGGSAGIARYRARGGLPPLLEVLQSPGCHRKTQDLVLSILANCCTESESRTEERGLKRQMAALSIEELFQCMDGLHGLMSNLSPAGELLSNKKPRLRQYSLGENTCLCAQVRKLGGIGHVVAALKNIPVETVQNRAARALGNLAIDPENSTLIHSAGGAAPLILCLSPSSSSSSPGSGPSAAPCPKLECAQSAARALLYLSDTPSNRLSLLSQGALPALAVLIAPEYPSGLRRASLRALGELTRGCSAECVREVSRCGALAQLGALAMDESTRPLGEIALKTLANLCTQGCLRPLVGSLGVIQRFVEEVKRSPSKSAIFFRALCLCCKEAVNRVKVKESGGLDVLIGFLSANPRHPLSRLAVLAFVDFVYDESAMEQLQGLGLVPLLVSRLVDLAKGEETAVGELDTPLSSSLMDISCFDSFDFPPPEGHRREEGGKEQAQGSSSFLSLRAWLLSEGLISSEGELLSPSGGGEGNWSSLCASFSPPVPLSDGLPALPCPSPTPAVPLQASTPVSCSAASPAPGHTLPSSCHKRAAPFVSAPPPAPPSTLQQSPHKPVSSPPFQPSSPLKKQAQSRTPSGAISPETPPGPSYQHPYHPEPWTSESPILLLLSRFSQVMDPSAALIHSGVLPGLLYYLTQREDPSSRCFRMLGRLSCNPNCLQGLVRTGAAALIRPRLCLREGLREGDRQTDRVKTSTRQLGKTLLSNLRLQCESSFGSGVLSHIMLSGSDTDRLYCTLSLPLITSNKLLQKKLLLDSGGLQSALEHIAWHDDSKDHTHGFWKSLAGWLHPSQPVSPGRLRSLYFSLLTECLSCLIGQPKLEQDNQRAWLGSGTDVGMLPINVIVPVVPESHLPPPFKKPCLTHHCPYLDSDFDVTFLLDDGSQLSASEDALAWGDGSERVGSEYFRALLKGSFGEAQRRSGEGIPIRDVTAKMLLPVLHYLHGCCASPSESKLNKGMGTVAQIESQKGTGCYRTGGHCMVLRSLAVGGLGEEFQNNPLAEAMAGASRFLVSELQEDLEALCLSLLQSFSALQPVSVTSATRQASEDTERNLISKADCCLQAHRLTSADKSRLEPMCERGRGQDLHSKSDVEFVVLVETRKQAVGSGKQHGGSGDLRGQTLSRSKPLVEEASDVGARKKTHPQCVLNLASRATHSVQSAFKTSDIQLDSRKESAARFDSGLVSESANLVNGLLKQSKSGSPNQLDCQLMFERKDEGEAETADSETLSYSELQPGTSSMERGRKFTSDEDTRPRLGSGERSPGSAGTGSAAKPVGVMKTQLNFGTKSYLESANVSGIELSDQVQDLITIDKITTLSHYCTNQDLKPGLEPYSGSRETSALDQNMERLSRATSKSCFLSDRSPSTKLGSALQKDCASDLDSHRPDPTSEPYGTSSPRSDQVSWSQSLQDLKASCLSDLRPAKPSGPKLHSSSRHETEFCSPAAPSLRHSPMSDTDCEKQSLIVTLPELYRFSQLHNYPRLRQMCLSVLLWQQRTSSQLSPSLAADCMYKLARRSHCIETLKQDLLLLVTGALS